ncbi:MAG: hypothetical protein COA91_13610 [Robiginitomaculum sp.]|nr:MAG: hypothetical protein COA91_13610 [Robiginitomaculum sp.]
MGSLLFSPNGSIGSAEFMRAGFILVAIAALLGVVAYLMPQMSDPLGYLQFLLLYPWAVIWIKRLRDGGKSGWMFLVYLLIYVVLAIIAFLIVGGGEIMKLSMEAASEGMGKDEMTAKAEAIARSIQIPSMIVGAIVSLIILYIGDKTIPKGVSED